MEKHWSLTDPSGEKWACLSLAIGEHWQRQSGGLAEGSGGWQRQRGRRTYGALTGQGEADESSGALALNDLFIGDRLEHLQKKVCDAMKAKLIERNREINRRGLLLLLLFLLPWNAVLKAHYTGPENSWINIAHSLGLNWSCFQEEGEQGTTGEWSSQKERNCIHNTLTEKTGTSLANSDFIAPCLCVIPGIKL